MSFDSHRSDQAAESPSPSVLDNGRGRERLGLALGGGGARGLAHIGVLKVLEEAGVEVALATGTSFGGLVALGWAAGYTADQLREIALNTSVVSLLGRDRTGLGISGTEKVGELIQRLVGCDNLEDLPRPCAVVATDLSHGTRVVFTSGSVATAARATIAVPGLFSPVLIGDQVLADGGILEPIPVEAAYQLGATRVIAVHVGPARERPLAQWLPLGLVPSPLTRAPFLRRLLARWRLFDVGTMALEVEGLEIAEMRLAQVRPWLVLRPEVGALRLDDFARAEECIAAGEKAAREALPVLLAGRST